MVSVDVQDRIGEDRVHDLVTGHVYASSIRFGGPRVYNASTR